MSLIGNLLWLLLGGLWWALGYTLLGLLLCITIIGIPFGKQFFKLARLVLSPFGVEIQQGDGGGVGSVLGNLLWLLCGGLLSALGNLLHGVVLCITIIGFPFGLQYFKLAGLVLMPFGKEIVPK